jgi:hypothetical protein
MKKVFAIGAFAALVLTGCAETDGNVSGAKEDGLNLTEYVYQYEGNDLHCVGYEPGYRAGLLTCDFVRYHNENGASNG